jgi:hypothetical protein
VQFGAQQRQYRHEHVLRHRAQCRERRQQEDQRPIAERQVDTPLHAPPAATVAGGLRGQAWMPPTQTYLSSV